VQQGKRKLDGHYIADQGAFFKGTASNIPATLRNADLIGLLTPSRVRITGAESIADQPAVGTSCPPNPACRRRIARV
jgi:hypothetical protein